MARDKEKHREWIYNRRRERKKQLIEKFGDKCADCGGSFHPACYDFHHVNPEDKGFEIAPGLDRNWEVILEEVEKTVMLCSNCHRIRHADY